MKLKNKVALITGASRGIGRAIALLFGKEGAKVAVNYCSSEKEAEAVVSEIKKFGSDAFAIKCDVSQENEVKNMIAQVVKKFGRIDILVNNAGIVLDIPIFEKTIEQVKRTIDVNLIGTFLCSKHASQQMKSGKIINISSTNGINTPSPDAADYDASKAGIIALTKDFAKMLAPKIHVNSVAPGWVNTDMNKNLPKEFLDGEMEKTYLKRMAKPEEIAKAILFLASDDASYITGTTLIVDGGHD